MPIYPWHEQFWQTLLADKARLPHALLLQGKSGTGKLALARELAQALLCETPEPNGFPCRQCPACNWFATGHHPDFKVLEPEALEAETDADSGDAESAPRAAKKASKDISVAQVRELTDMVNLSTHRNGMRIVLIHPAEAMNVQAANALLKTLEEPPANSLFLLVTHQPQRLLATIRSRCRTIDMPAPGKESAERWLQQQGVANAPLHLALASYAPLDALDGSAAACQEIRNAFLQQLADFRTLNALALAEKMAKEDMVLLLDWLQKWIYDLLCLRFAGKLRYHLDFEANLRELAKRVNLEKLQSYQQELLLVRRNIQHPLNAQLLLENILLTYSQLVDRKKEPQHV